MELFIAVVIMVLASLVVGFIAGSMLGAKLTNEAKSVERRVRASVAEVVLSLHNHVEEGRAKLEKDTQESFSVVSADVENIVKRLEAVEHNLSVKAAAVIQSIGGDAKA